jgi:DNA-binding MarR family transcriptional regulator
VARAEKIIPFRPVNSNTGESDELRLHIDVRLSVDETPWTAAGNESSGPPNQHELCCLASAIYDGRRRRDRAMEGELFGEPAWDMLLALYCLPARGERLGVTALSYAANVPQSTGLRVQGLLAKSGLIQRRREGSDGRRYIVSLTSHGQSVLEKYLTDFGSRAGLF